MITSKAVASVRDKSVGEVYKDLTYKRIAPFIEELENWVSEFQSPIIPTEINIEYIKGLEELTKLVTSTTAPKELHVLAGSKDISSLEGKLLKSYNICQLYMGVYLIGKCYMFQPYETIYVVDITEGTDEISLIRQRNAFQEEFGLEDLLYWDIPLYPFQNVLDLTVITSPEERDDVARSDYKIIAVANECDKGYLQKLFPSNSEVFTECGKALIAFIKNQEIIDLVLWDRETE